MIGLIEILLAIGCGILLGLFIGEWYFIGDDFDDD